ncbi:hypothetical protein LCGC14_1494730 [marine sediment metagenome]|uniref:Uncharacterized protein n=1 Tax=marine sediment metagenome TaxID=412755 RepID=A0A0F9M7B5_9ZZZZ
MYAMYRAAAIAIFNGFTEVKNAPLTANTPRALSPQRIGRRNSFLERLIPAVGFSTVTRLALFRL